MSIDKIKLASIDPGKGRIKGVHEGEGNIMVKKSYPAKFTQKETIGESAGSIGTQTFDIIYNEQGFSLGMQGASDTRKEGSTKRLDEHRIAMYTSIALMLNPNSQEREKVNVVLSIPASSYLDSRLLKKYEDFFFEVKDIDININGLDYSFTINDLLLLPEGLGYIFNNESKVQGEHLLVDIGHLNLSFSTIKDGNIVSSETSEDGGYELERIVKENYYSAFEKEIPADYIYKALTDGIVGSVDEKIEKDSEQVISDAKQEYLDHILETASDLNIPIGMFDGIHFIGKHSENFEEAIADHHFFSKKAVIPKDPQWETATGNFLIATAYFDRKYSQEDNNEVEVRVQTEDDTNSSKSE